MSMRYLPVGLMFCSLFAGAGCGVRNPWREIDDVREKVGAIGQQVNGMHTWLVILTILVVLICLYLVFQYIQNNKQ